MAGTPIKIPGKNLRDSSKSAVLARKNLKRPRGRPLKPQSSKLTSNMSQSLSSAPRKSRVRTLKNIKSKHKMSQLEKLPTELLETIFLFSLNLNLPECSPVIGGKLSSETIYCKTIIAAFDTNWGRWYGKTHETLYEAVHTPSECYLQSRILRCRWARLPVLLRSQDQWVRKYGQGLKFTPMKVGLMTRDLCSRESGIEVVDPNAVSAAELLDHQLAKYRYIIKKVGEWSPTLDQIHEGPHLMLEFNHTSTYSYAHGIEIPHTLLMGPWDEGAVKFLFWLVIGGARIDWLTSTSGEAAMIGYKNAVRENKIEVMHLLSFAGLMKKVDEDIIKYTVEHADANQHFPAVLSMIYSMPLPFDCEEKFERIAQFKDSPEHEDYIEKVRLIEQFEDWHRRLHKDY